MLELPRSARLLDGQAFKQVFAARRAIGDAYFRIHYAPSEQPRLGMAVSRRVHRRAVVRNRIRRQIRESFRLQRPTLRSLDFVVLARPASAALNRKDLRAALDQLWQRFKVTP